ncbi:hypothetical protein PF003_g37878 [Phytophthora fragariae]|nr:hypothetical protein PF003_g37878 [Phytophthora fragariae]
MATAWNSNAIRWRTRFLLTFDSSSASRRPAQSAESVSVANA